VRPESCCLAPAATKGWQGSVTVRGDRLPLFGANPVRQLATRWRQRAAELRPFAEPAARAFELAADELAASLAQGDGELLTLKEASRESQYSVDHLARRVREGSIPNAGRPHAPRIRRADLPRRAPVAHGARSGYDVAADARDLLSARREDR